MFLKIIVVLLFIGVLASLSSGLIFLLKDMNVPDSKRTVYALGVRITLAASLLGVIIYGVYSGQLGSTAPWDREIQSEASQN